MEFVFFFLKKKKNFMLANSVDKNVASDLDLHCLHRSPKKGTLGKYGLRSYFSGIFIQNTLLNASSEGPDQMPCSGASNRFISRISRESLKDENHQYRSDVQSFIFINVTVCPAMTE